MKLAKLATVSVLVASMVPFAAMAAGNSGTVKFAGSIVESPCNIEQASLNQTVEFGQLSKAALESNQVAEAAFDIKLTDCSIAAGKSVNLTFAGQNYAGGGEYLATSSENNKNNVGVKIDGVEFGTATDVTTKLLNVNGDNVLNFKALAKRIDASANVLEGKLEATSNFIISYQ